MNYSNDKMLNTMQKDENSFIQDIIQTCTELEASISVYCDLRECLRCDFHKRDGSCRYRMNLFMLLKGYSMGACDEAEKQLINDYIKAYFPTFQNDSLC